MRLDKLLLFFRNGRTIDSIVSFAGLTGGALAIGNILRLGKLAKFGKISIEAILVWLHIKPHITEEHAVTSCSIHVTQ